MFRSTAEKQGLSIDRFNRIPFSVCLPSKKYKFVSSGSWFGKENLDKCKRQRRTLNVDTQYTVN